MVLESSKSMGGKTFTSILYLKLTGYLIQIWVKIPDGKWLFINFLCRSETALTDDLLSFLRGPSVILKSVI